MSIEVFVAGWLGVAMLVFLAAALTLDSRSTPDKDKVWIGRIGLAAPLWPVMAVAALVIILFLMARELFRAARGQR